jgi:hypothetical protein
MSVAPPVGMRTFNLAVALSALLGGSALAGGGPAAYQPARVVRPPRSQPAGAPRASSRTVASSELSQRARSIASGLESTIRHVYDTPAFELLPTGAARLSLIRYPDVVDYTNGKHAIYKVSDLPQDGLIDLVALMPVSGHVGSTPQDKLATAEHYAKTNVYNMMIEHPDGSVENIDGIRSQGMVTPHELQLKLQPGSTIIRFTPAGTSYHGYLNGRTIELQLDAPK